MTFTFSVHPSDWLGIAPLVVLVVMALVVMLVDIMLPHEGVRSKHTGPASFAVLPVVSVIGILLSMAATVVLFNIAHSTIVFNNMVAADNGTLYADLLILTAGGLGVLLSPSFLKRLSLVHQGEYYALFLFSMAGMMLMASATSFVIIFVGLELFSLALYILCSFVARRRASQEAGMKYFLLSSFASAFLLYGIALIYASTDSTFFTTIRAFMAHRTQSPTLLLVGMGLLIVGFAFKVSAVPFQAWTPDVYQGAPAPVTAFMSVGTKVAALLAFVRVFGFVLSNVQGDWLPVVWVAAVLTMVIGNVLALSQRNIKRLLAYSSITHGGYLLIGVVVCAQAQQHIGVSAILFYLTCYLFMNIGAFGVISLLERSDNSGYDAGDLRGLWYRRPVLAGLLAFFLLSLAGFPIMAGFAAKYYIFYAALVGGHPELLVIGILASVLGIYYYLRFIATMFMEGRDLLATETVAAPAGLPSVPATPRSTVIATTPRRVTTAATSATAVAEKSETATSTTDSAQSTLRTTEQETSNNLVWMSYLALGIAALGTLVIGIILPLWLPALQQISQLLLP